jgi:hypothetical protein
MEDWCCNLAVCGYAELAMEGGSMRLVMEGDALARFKGGESGGGATGVLCGFDSNNPPRIGS